MEGNIEPMPLKLGKREPLINLKINANEPKPLDLVAKGNVIPNLPKKFDLSLSYVKSKVPNINSFVYAQIRPVLDSIDRTNQSKPDIEILNFGKSLQENIAKKSMELSNTSDIELLDKISASYKIIVDCIEVDKKGILQNIVKFFSSNNTDNMYYTLSEEVKNNKVYRRYLEDFDKKYPTTLKQLKDLKNDMVIYIEVAQLLITEFTNEGFDVHVDYVNRRIISLFQSKAMLDNTIAMIELNIQKCRIYMDNIDSVVNVLIPTLLTKMKLKDYLNDTSYQELSSQIVEKLKDKNV